MNGAADLTVGGLAVSGLAVDLAGRRVLDQVDLTVAAGELVGLIGPNGAGKTTLLRAVLGLVKPVSGHVAEGLGRRRPAETRLTGGGGADGIGRLRGRIGYVPQRHEFAWDFPISVAGAVMTGLTGQLGLLRRPGPAAWRAAAEALELTGLAALAGRAVGQLSAGQRQRVLLARALAPGPAALLLDEPFTGLDMPAQASLGEVLAGLARDGRAVLMATHDVFGALDLCDRIVLLNRTVIAAGPPAAVAADTAAWRAAFSVSADNSWLRALKAAAA